MSRVSCAIAFVCSFAFIVVAVETRSIHETILVEPFNDTNRQLLHAFTSYRHRFEQSPNFQALKWSFAYNKQSPVCDLCDIGAPFVRYLLTLNDTKLIDEAVTIFCKEYKGLDHSVCLGAAHEYMPAVFEVVKLAPLTNKELCSLAFECEPQRDFPVFSWNVTFPDKPKPTPRPPQPPSPDAPKLNILHLSDIHVDFAYKVGSQADCPQPLCCRGGEPAPGHSGAGQWGDYRNCDIPFWTAEAILKYAAQTENIDFIYYTGDLPAHNVWNQTREQQIYSINTINQLLLNTFPNKTFYSAVGNHEAAPCNLYPTPNIKTDNISWLYNVLAENWIKLGLPETTRSSIQAGAFYSTIVRPGLRLISLNMNYCTTDNYWILINSTDPAGQLQWLVETLQTAEDNNEKVHIIGHQPPSSCTAAYSWNYNTIVNRYENTIAGQFFGHAHAESFKMFYDENDSKRPISMAFVGPSLTTYSYLNPGYRTYTIDGYYNGTSYWTVDAHTTIMNLTATNLLNQTVFAKEYDARQAYELKNLFPSGWGDLVERLSNDLDGKLMGLVYQYYTKSYADGSQCDHKCRRGLLCDIISPRTEDPHACDSIPAL